MAGSERGLTPRQSIEFERRRRGEAHVVAQCVAILQNQRIGDDTLVALAGPHAMNVIRESEGGMEGYWPRVWAMRAFLYAWGPSATDAMIAGSADAHWRVRGMSAKVVALRRLDLAHDAMTTLLVGDVARVRGAAEGALIRLVQSAP